MRNLKIKVVVGLIIVCFLGCFDSGDKNAAMKVYAFQLEEADPRELKVLVISIDPEIKNPLTGNMESASQYLGFSLDASVSSLKQCIEKGSNGMVGINIVDTIYLNEFPRYQGFDSMTEEQFFQLFPVDSSGKGEWFGWWQRNVEMNVIAPELDASMYFDYSYLVDKCELETMRAKGKFDMVWVYGLDPLSMYESAMVGESAFWVNGKAVKAKCENFVMLGLTFSRSDGALESFCHLCEAMMNYTYGITDAEYNKPIEFDDFSELSTWQKFYLCQHKSTSDNIVYGVGQVHFSPNSTEDYDWESKIPVKSYHQEFLENYPEITNENTTTFTASEYMDNSVYDNEYNNEAAGVRHHLWWLQHMPHYKGRDENGYLHNWWEYLLDTKYVVSLNADTKYASNKVVIPLGNLLTDLSFEIKYNTGKSILTTIQESGAVLKYEKNNIFSVSDGKITAKTVGKEKLIIMYDGHELEYMIEVPEPVYKITIINGTGKKESIEKEVIKITANEPKKGMRFKEWKVVGGNVKLKSITAEKTSFTMPREEVTIEAVYETIPKYKVTVIGGEGSGEVYADEKVSIEANEPEKEMQFKEWKVIEGKDLLNLSKKVKLTFVMPEEDVTLEAIYEPIPRYSVTVISGEGNGENYAGTTIRIKADEAEKGTYFVGWKVTKGNVEVKSETEETTFVMPEEDVVLEAVYEPIPKYAIAVIGGEGAVKVYADATVTIKADVRKGKVFKKWKVRKGNIELSCATDIEVTFKMPEENILLEAVYEKEKQEENFREKKADGMIIETVEENARNTGIRIALVMRMFSRTIIKFFFDYF